MIKVSFYGGAQDVTGTNHMMEIGSTKLLVDCGLFQGTKTCEEQNYNPFPYNPAEVDFLFITHAHLDHVGRIPKLVRDGFKGKIISTPPTRDFAKIMLEDSLGILTKEAIRENREPIYKEEDLKKVDSLWETVNYNEKTSYKDFSVILRESGHILGSAIMEFTVKGNPSTSSGQEKIVFTGDLGNSPMPLLNDPYKITDADYLIIESVYGDKEHEDVLRRKEKIERTIEKVAAKKGALMIPAFSIERTQQLLYEMNDLFENKQVPPMPVFLDSPLAIKATEVYRKYKSYYDAEAREIMSTGDDIFHFPGLKTCLTTEDSKAINNISLPKIIIAGSGMSTGGRIIHHEKRYLPDPNSVLLIIGYQAAGSLGRLLVEGAKYVKILGENVPVNAEVVSVRGYSAHPDVNGLLNFVKNTHNSLKKVFVVQGETKSALFFTQRIRDYMGLNAVAPKFGDSYEIK